MRLKPRSSALFLVTLLFLQPAAAQTVRPSAEAIAAEAQLQQAYALHAFFADVDRIERVAFVLLRAAAPYCAERQQWAIGAAPRSLWQVPPPLRDKAPVPATGAAPSAGAAASAADVALGDDLAFVQVIAGSPAALAGVQPGDRLLALNGQSPPGGAPSQPWFHQQVNQQAQQSAGGVLRLRVLRAGQPLELPLTPQRLCPVTLQYALSDSVNAAAGVNQLLVTSGMLRFAADDADLAMVLGHELAHALLRHPEALAAAKARGAGSVGANNAGNSAGNEAGRAGAPRDPYSQDKERDADRLGLYLSAAAGFDIGHAPELWRRMAARAPGQIRDNFGASHPSSPERFLLLRSVAAEIDARQKRGDSLVPPLAELQLFAYTPERAAAEAAAAERPVPLPDIAQLPFLNDDGRAAYQAFTATHERPRALALSLRGHVSMRSGADAAAEALASCNVLARGACRLVALDELWLGGSFVPVSAPAVSAPAASAASASAVVSAPAASAAAVMPVPAPAAGK